MQKFDPSAIRFLDHFGRERVDQFGRDLTGTGIRPFSAPQT